MTPAALTQICMIPNGDGKQLGDVIHQEDGQRKLFGVRLEVVGPTTTHESRIALFDPRSAKCEWHNVKNALDEIQNQDAVELKPVTFESLQKLMLIQIEAKGNSLPTSVTSGTTTSSPLWPDCYSQPTPSPSRSRP